MKNNVFMGDSGPLSYFQYQAAFIPQLYWNRQRVSWTRPGLGAPALGQKKPPPPGVCCQAMDNGGVICSDGKGFPPR